ncbi:hypothetical protein ETEC_p948_0440 (plasmid) [Escherichia coli ETEC H10407]|nr:hypothetical protein ETEC_p948_0440 [Escherichia coli ETEC H10407]
MYITEKHQKDTIIKKAKKLKKHIFLLAKVRPILQKVIVQANQTSCLL